MQPVLPGGGGGGEAPHGVTGTLLLSNTDKTFFRVKTRRSDGSRGNSRRRQGAHSSAAFLPRSRSPSGSLAAF